MTQTKLWFLLFLRLIAGSTGVMAQSPNAAIGVFESHEDIGANPKSGSLAWSASTREYRVTGGGANIWGAQDALRFVWKRVSGDLTFTADVRFLGEGTDPHRKAVLMIRQNLTPGSAYADIAVHGDGLASLQFRPAADGPTQEVRSPEKAPARLRIERRGNRFTIYAGKAGETLTATGPQTVELSDPVYVGIGVSSHNADVLETAVFSHVELESRPAAPSRYRSSVKIFDMAKKSAEVVHSADGVIEAPNWSRDGKYLLVNTGGDLYRLPLATAEAPAALQKINLEGGPYRCNNDHDLSFDGKLIAFSASHGSSRQSRVYVANADGSHVRLVTPTGPSYFHGWSPDSKWLAFVGQRNGKFEIYRISASGGPEERLTSIRAYDDGPEYSRDGKWIYFNSDRGGGWNIWRMPADGAGPEDKKAEQLTSDPWEDWFPHLSPDGKQMVLLSFPPGTKGHNERLAGVSLRTRAASGTMETLTQIYGGQGSINVNSWSPDSTKFAFVEYQPIP